MAEVLHRDFRHYLYQKEDIPVWLLFFFLSLFQSCNIVKEHLRDGFSTSLI